MSEQGMTAAGENTGGCCEYAGAGRGDCEHYIGLPGRSIPGQHDGPDDTVDAYGKPNGWCWQCWKSHQIGDLQAHIARLEQALRIIAGEEQCVDNLMSNADVAREALAGAGEPSHVTVSVDDLTIASAERYDEGQADMRERAAKTVEDTVVTIVGNYRLNAGPAYKEQHAAAIRALPLTEGKADDR